MFTVPRVLFGIIGLVLIVALLDGADSNLEVVADGTLLRVTNVGSGVLQLNRVLINDRADCNPLDLSLAGKVLKVGDQRLMMSPCNIVRATISTSEGSSTFEFAK